MLFNVKIDSTEFNIETIDFWSNAEIQSKKIIDNESNILVSRLFLGNSLIEDQFLFVKNNKKWELNKYYSITESDYPNLEKCLKNIHKQNNTINLINEKMSDGCKIVDDYNNTDVW